MSDHHHKQSIDEREILASGSSVLDRKLKSVAGDERETPEITDEREILASGSSVSDRKLKSVAGDENETPEITDEREILASGSSVSDRKLKSVAGDQSETPEIIDDESLASGSSVLDRKLKSVIGDQCETSATAETPDRYEREARLKILVAKESLPVESFDLGDIAAMTNGFTREELANLVNKAALLAQRQKKAVVEKVDFVHVVKQFIEGTMKKTVKLQSFEKGVVAGHEASIDIANLRPGTPRGSLNQLVQLESNLPLRLKYRNLKFRYYALRRLETIWSSGGIYCCWFPYVAMDLFDSLPPLVDVDVDLVVVSCLTLACKMQKRKFHTTAFLLERGLAYNLEEVVRMELHLLRSMEWNIRQLTPFCFVQCLAHELPESCNVRCVYSIIVWTKASSWFSSFSPSTIASSAILCSTQSEDHKVTIRRKLEACEVEVTDDCTNLMEAIYQTKLTSLRAGPSNISEENFVMNVAVEWIEQITRSEARVGWFYGALACICPLSKYFQFNM